MWTVVYMSKNADDISRLKSELRKSAVITMVRERDGFLEILVPSCEVFLAHKTIIDMEF